MRARPLPWDDVIDALPGLVWYFAEDESVVSFNRALSRFTGLPGRTVDSRAFADLMHPDDRTSSDAAVRRGRSAGVPYEFKCRLRRYDGVGRWHVLRVVPLGASAGGPSRWAGIAVDVSERTETRRQLEQSEERLRLAVDAAGLGIHDYDRQQGTCVWSERMYALFGVPPGTPITSTTIADRVHPDDLPRVLAAAAQALQLGHGAYAQDYRVRCGETGDLRWVHEATRVWFGRDGDAAVPQRITGMLMDITPRKQAEAALQEADRQKDEFIAMLAHELRNPLAPIRTAVDLLATAGDHDSVVARCRMVIDRQTTQMARMLDDLLDVVRLSRGQFVPVRSAVRLGEVLSAAVETSRPLVDQHAHQLEVRSVTGDLVVDGDPVRLTQVFANLLNNAAKYSPPGGRIEVTARAEAGQALVRVRDSGPGLAPEVRSRMFEPFVRGDEARRQVPDGLGIGLSLARRLVEIHGGEIRLGPAGGGAEFVVALPLAAAPEAPGVPQAVEAPAPARRSTRVLVVDDNLDAADMLRLWLRRTGCEVRVAHNGHTALAEADQFRPQVVLLDLGMPGLDGYEVCRSIRAQRWGSRMRLVAISGWGQDEHRRRSAAAGFDCHLLKPVEPTEVLRIVTESSTRAGRRRVLR